MFTEVVLVIVSQYMTIELLCYIAKAYTMLRQLSQFFKKYMCVSIYIFQNMFITQKRNPIPISISSYP